MSELLDVTIVQTNLFWDSPKENRDHLDLLLSNVGKTDVVVFPELFSTAFSVSSKAEKMDGDTVVWLEQKAKSLSALIIGSLIIEDKEEKFNRLICYYPSGKFSYYDKRHLFSLMDEDHYFSKGNSKLVVNYKGWKICPLICYDLRFPVFSRNKENYDVLVYIANWPQSRIDHWNKLLPARAIENQAYVVAVNRIGFDANEVYFNGSSSVIDFNGSALLSLENEEVCINTSLSKSKLMNYRNKFPFLSDMDDFKMI